MKKHSAVDIFTIFLLTMLATPLSGFYREGTSAAKNEPLPGRLVVKLDGNLKIAHGCTRENIAITGIPSFDVVNQRHGVTKQEVLYTLPASRHHPASLRNVLVITVPGRADPLKMIADYENLPEVVYVHPDRIAELYDAPDDPLFSHQWSLHNSGQGYYHVLRRPGEYNDTLVIDTGLVDADIDAFEVFNAPPDNTRTIVVAIIDTGIDLDHPDLAGRIWTNVNEIPDNGLDDDHNGYVDDIQGWDFCSPTGPVTFDEDNDPTDSHGHGTHCAGIVTAVGDNAEGIAGIVADCRIMPLKFGPVLLSSLAARAVVYAADNGTDVISMSFGYPWPVQVLEDALAYARAKGVILCASSGNDGDEYPNYPAAYSGVIAVGATTSSDEVADFSTYGDHLDVCAPGQSILSLRADTTDMYAESAEPNVHIIDEHYYLASGTSMSCPAVAGIAGYMRAVSSGLSPDQAQGILESTAYDIIDPYGSGQSYPGWDKYTGHGRVNLHDALIAVPRLRAIIEAPKHNQIVSGPVPVVGVADGEDFSGYVLEYGSGSIPGVWTEINASAVPVTDGLLGEWNTVGLEGQYIVRLRLGETNFSSTSVYVANSAVAILSTPSDQDTIPAITAITGSASAPDFAYYVLEYGQGSTPAVWREIAAVTTPVVDDELAQWNASTLSDGLYTLRLSVHTGAGPVATSSIQVYASSPFAGERGWRVSLGDSLTVMPNYGDFDADGAEEIVLSTNHGIQFLHPDGTLKTSGIPSVPAYDFLMPAAVGDLDGDGVEDFVAAGIHYSETDSIGKLVGYPSSGLPFEVDLPIAPRNMFLSASVYQHPYVFLKDIDSDGQDEIHYYTGWFAGVQAYYYVYNGDGTFRSEIPMIHFDFYGYLSADLNGDGMDEIYVSHAILYEFDSTGSVNYFDLMMGEGVWFRVEDLSACDMDGDEKLELIVFGSYDGDPGTYRVFAFDEGLELKPGWPHDTGIDNYLQPSPPVFADIDRDGGMEYFLAVFELTYAQIHAWNIDGTPYAGNPVLGSTLNPAMLFNAVIGDVDGDMYPDIVACAENDILRTYEVERIQAWNRFGECLSGWPLVTVPDMGAMITPPPHYPVIGDLDRDGYTDLMMTTADHHLVFTGFEDCDYVRSAIPVPCWRYNRRLNNVLFVVEYTCGDANGDNSVNLLDILFLIDYLYNAPPGPSPDPPQAGDANGDGSINLLDILYLIDHLYGSPAGPEPICP
ncbi:MAG: S8 family serine peptidase [Candidatus Zixiibacteriota bacterium]|nr:MAG: S8 family serine peptidase [candidate division Zixibacteria bacterium]